VSTETTSTNDPGTQQGNDPQGTTTAQQRSDQGTYTPPTPQPNAPVTEWDGKVESLDPKVRQYVEQLRRENGTTRVNAKQQAADEARQSLVNELGKALGLVKDGDQGPTPEQLTEQLTSSQQAARDAAVQLAVYRAAAGHQADPDALLDSRRFVESLADIDPSDGPAVDDAIKAAITANPKLKVGRAPGASSVDHGAASSGEGAVTPEVFARMSPRQRNDLFESHPALYDQLTGR